MKKSRSKSYSVWLMLKALGSDIEAVNNKGNPNIRGAGKGFYGKYPGSENWVFLGYSKYVIRSKFMEGLIR